MPDSDLYLEGEERFGSFSSYIYGTLLIPILNRYYRIIKEDLSGRKIAKLLDVGAGPCKLVSMLAQEMPVTQFYCVDPSTHMLSIAQKNMKKYGLSERVHISLGSSRAIPFNEKFDAIISSFSYHHWKDRDESLANLVNYLNEGGFIFIYEYDNNKGKLKNSHGVREEEWQSLSIEGVEKEIDHRNGIIILRLYK